MAIPVPRTDRRAVDLRRVDATYELPHYATRRAWEARAQELRTHILAVTGLLPPPDRPPLRAQVFGTTHHEDYSVSKVYFQSYRAFLVTGNLFVPRGKRGPFPAVLNPHGHWEEGRLANNELGTVLGRGISFARQGYVAFCHDMIGYHDSSQVVHRQESDRQRLWGFSQMALQLYNSIRSIDFLQSLPMVDPERIGCTGESGGGTQTYMLMAADERIKVAAPVVMVSSEYQGGCVCENAPSLRVDTANPELSALMAPRPLLLVSCTRDWTKRAPESVYPFLKSIYRLYRAEDRVESVIFDADHNYNLDSRNAVYAFFGKWLLGCEDPEAVRERPYRMDSAQQYLVFADRKRPSYAPAGERLFDRLIRQRRRQLRARRPADKSGLARFRAEVGPAMSHLLMARAPEPREVRAVRLGAARAAGVSGQRLILTRPAVGDRVPAYLLRPARDRKPAATLIVSHRGKEALFHPGKTLHPLVAKLLGKGQTLLLIDPWGIGEARIPLRRAQQAAEIHHYLTYNRSDDANRIQDILTGLGYLRSLRTVNRVDLIGLGCAGAWCLLARTQASFVHRTIVDMAACRLAGDQDFGDHLLIPALRNIGDLLAAVSLIAPGRLCLLAPGKQFDLAAAREVYAAAGRPEWLCLHEKMPAEFRSA